MRTLENICDYHGGWAGTTTPATLLAKAGVTWPVELKAHHLHGTAGLGHSSVVVIAIALAQEVVRLNSIIDKVQTTVAGV